MQRVPLHYFPPIVVMRLLKRVEIIIYLSFTYRFTMNLTASKAFKWIKSVHFFKLFSSAYPQVSPTPAMFAERAESISIQVSPTIQISSDTLGNFCNAFCIGSGWGLGFFTSSLPINTSKWCIKPRCFSSSTENFAVFVVTTPKVACLLASSTASFASGSYVLFIHVSVKLWLIPT